MEAAPITEAAAGSDFRYDVVDGIAIATLSRPERLNALSRSSISGLIEMLDEVDADDRVRALVFTGEGRAFCAGAALGSEGSSLGGSAASVQAQDAVDPDWGGLLTLRLFDCLKPTIAAANGAAVGVGASMQLAMDVRLASEDARYGFVFARRGIVPESAASWFLPRVVGVSTALEWCFSGRLVPAAEALERGLVRSIHSREALMEDAVRLAHEMTDQSAPVSVALTRRMIWRMLGAAHPEDAHRVDSRGVSLRARSADAREGVNAFIEKRPAIFPDRVSVDMPDIFEEGDRPRSASPSPRPRK